MRQLPVILGVLLIPALLFSMVAVADYKTRPFCKGTDKVSGVYSDGALRCSADQGVITEAWIAPTLINSWVNFGSAHPPVVGYRKAADGRVTLRGAIKNGVVGTVAFVLPVGYRPPYRMDFGCSGWNGAAHILSTVSADADGNVYVRAGNTAGVWLNDVSFYVD